MAAMAALAEQQPESCVSPDFVEIVYQTMPELPPLRPEILDTVAEEAEFYIREVIHRAKKHMNHSKRPRMLVSDIELGAKHRGHPPTLGHRSIHPPTYDAIGHDSGLFVAHDDVTPLDDVLRQPLPPVLRPPSVEASWLFVRCAGETMFQENRRARQTDPTLKSNATHPISSAVNALLTQPAGSHPHDLDTVLRAIVTAPSLPLASLTALLQTTVRRNARGSGDAEKLTSAMRVTMALSARRRFGLELFRDQLLPPVLTCLVGRRLGRLAHAARDVRARARDALFALLSEAGDDSAAALVRGRVAKTVVPTLTDVRAPLACVAGAVHALAVVGQPEFEGIVVPCLPDIHDRLRRAARRVSASHDGGGTVTGEAEVEVEVEEEARARARADVGKGGQSDTGEDSDNVGDYGDVTEDVLAVCHAVQRGMYECRVQPYPTPVVDVIL